MITKIDTSRKMYEDTPSGKDPDTYSRTLRDYHLLLWNKPLPTGKPFALTANDTPPYNLRHSSDIGNFRFSSDSILHTYTRWTRLPLSEIVQSIPKVKRESFYDNVNSLSKMRIMTINSSPSCYA